MTGAPPVVLASASRSRHGLLTQAGVPLAACEAATVDEEEVKLALRGEGATAAQVAETLAELKATCISRRYPGALVVGADQMLDCEGQWFDKPQDLARAAEQLLALAGKAHRLETAVCVVCDGARLWHHNAVARLTMRPFERGFVESYLETVGEAALSSVGAYQLEGRGVQFFSAVQGDFFTILGLPLLPLLGFLRARGVMPE